MSDEKEGLERSPYRARIEQVAMQINYWNEYPNKLIEYIDNVQSLREREDGTLCFDPLNVILERSENGMGHLCRRDGLPEAGSYSLISSFKSRVQDATSDGDY